MDRATSYRLVNVSNLFPTAKWDLYGINSHHEVSTTHGFFEGTIRQILLPFSDHRMVEVDGIEPTTSSLQS